LLVSCWLLIVEQHGHQCKHPKLSMGSFQWIGVDVFCLKFGFVIGVSGRPSLRVELRAKSSEERRVKGEEQRTKTRLGCSKACKACKASQASKAQQDKMIGSTNGQVRQELGVARFFGPPPEDPRLVSRTVNSVISKLGPGSPASSPGSPGIL
jgi:hypothetical protein